jgi:hypothetical protein
VEEGVHAHQTGKPLASPPVLLSTRPSLSLRRLPLLPEKEVRRRVKEGDGMNQPRVVMERREQRWMGIPAHRILDRLTSSVRCSGGASSSLPPGSSFKGGERGEALSSAGGCCGGWSRAWLFMAARHVVSCSGDRRRARVMHCQRRELCAWNRVSAAAPSPARSSSRARSLSAPRDSAEEWTIRSCSRGWDGRSMRSHTSAHGSTAVGEARRWPCCRSSSSAQRGPGARESGTHAPQEPGSTIIAGW